VKQEMNGPADVLLACSSGGHLLQLLALQDAWSGFSRLWVCEDTSDARSLLRGERVVFAHGPTHRNLKNGVGTIALAWLRNFALAWRVMGTLRPKVILTTGASTAVPFAWVGRLRGARVVFVESVTRIEKPSVSCRLIVPFADRVYVQWPELLEALPRARYAGTVLAGR
jgi:beta-1,4-N-acetylglucosaminyltransferase